MDNIILNEHNYSVISSKKNPGQLKKNNPKRRKIPVTSVKDLQKNEIIIEDSFFKKHIRLLIRTASEQMESIDRTYLSENMKNCILEIIANPNKIDISDELFKYLAILDNKKVNDQASFTTEVAKLVTRDDFSNAMGHSFSQLTEFALLNEGEKYQFVQCFTRRFLNEAKVKKVEIAAEAFAATKSTTQPDQPYPLMTVKESLDKEEKVIHHIGAYIARELILAYGYSASHFVKNALKLDSGELDDYTKWTQELSNGGLLCLKEKAFALFKKINDLGKIYYQKKNYPQKDRVAKALIHLKNDTFVKYTFFDLWGEGERKDAALKKGCKIYLNCLGKGFINQCKTEIQIVKRASLKTVSLRKEMKNQKVCQKCKNNDSKTEAECPKPKVPKTRKAPKGFLA